MHFRKRTGCIRTVRFCVLSLAGAAYAGITVFNGGAAHGNHTTPVPEKPLGIRRLVFAGGDDAFADAPEWMLRLMAGIALVFSGYGMGRFAGFRRRRKGWRCGLFCGLFLWAVLTLASLVWLHTAGSPVRLLCLCGGGVWGGISGVNAPHRKPPR